MKNKDSGRGLISTEEGGRCKALLSIKDCSRQKGLIWGPLSPHHGVVRHLSLNLLHKALLFGEDLEGHRQHVHKRDARHEPQDLSALGAEDVEELVGAVD